MSDKIPSPSASTSSPPHLGEALPSRGAVAKAAGGDKAPSGAGNGNRQKTERIPGIAITTGRPDRRRRGRRLVWLPENEGRSAIRDTRGNVLDLHDDALNAIERFLTGETGLEPSVETVEGDPEFASSDDVMKRIFGANTDRYKIYRKRYQTIAHRLMWLTKIIDAGLHKLITDKMRSECARLHAKGESATEIARKLNFSPATAQRFIAEAKEEAARKVALEPDARASVEGECAPKPSPLNDADLDRIMAALSALPDPDDVGEDHQPAEEHSEIEEPDSVSALPIT